MATSDLICNEKGRRQDVRDAQLYGFDYVEVDEDQRTLEVFFLGRAPAGVEMANVRITGGRKIRDIEVTAMKIVRQRDPSLDDTMEVSLDKYGDFSVYTLSLVALDEQGRPTDEPLPGFDPLYASVDFSFKACCPNDLDCAPQEVCPPPVRNEPDINYLAKDYDSFRRLILDRLALTMPYWTESHIPDIGIMLVELFAYAGDQLSYFQDAVATEAYLGTARHRISVRRHCRLVDYTLHEGCNARAFVTVSTDTNQPLDLTQAYFCTAFPGMPVSPVLEPDDMLKAPPGTFECFSPLPQTPDGKIDLVAAHSEMQFYGWGDCACCLPKGATSATLVDGWDEPGGKRALQLKVGEVLIFEEVVGPRTGNPADADPSHRQAVRLTKVSPNVDPLYKQPVVDIEWCSEDALTFPLCLSAEMPPPDCDCRGRISVARGNVILVGHGLGRRNEPIGKVGTQSSSENCPTDCAPRETVVSPAPFRPVLQGVPVTHSVPLDGCACTGALIVQDPRQAVPQITLTGAGGTTWTAVPDLLQSGPNDAHFVAEIDDGGVAHLRFGNGREGMMPEADAEFTATYSVGNGPAGNVGAETIRYIAFKQVTNVLGKVEPRNPLPARGGVAPETIAEAKTFAPFAFRSALERAVTADDYATLAADNARRLAERAAVFAAAAPVAQPAPSLPGPQADDPRAALEEDDDGENLLASAACFIPFQRLQGARGTLAWTGSWYEAQVAVDPLGKESADAELLAEIEGYLEPYRRVGHDLSVRQANYAPLDLALSVCVRPGALRGHVESALLDVFSNRVLPGGRLGFFHPDNLGFGGAVYASRIVAAAQAVSGVMEVRIARLARFDPGSPAAGADDDGAPHGGVLVLAPYEIARLDGDPSLPGNGRLTLFMRGGR
ncbi:MAG: putative baseplate assembly protein [Alphaproteobacteria bacterium]|nr:putative baseplate assembly protein [Alphaproteobacteria bacterium]